MFLKRNYRSEKCDYRTIWPIAFRLCFQMWPKPCDYSPEGSMAVFKTWPKVKAIAAFKTRPKTRTYGRV